MAIQRNGPNGAFIGRVGSIYGYMLGETNIIRGARRTSSRKPTDAELLNREKMKVTSLFLNPIYPIVKYGYKNLVERGSLVNASNLAQSHVRKECIQLDENGNPFVNPELFMPFRGSLSMPQLAEVHQNGVEVTITWQAPTADSKNYMRLNVLLYEIGTEVNDFYLSVADAREGTFSFSSETLQRNKSAVHVYISFVDSFSDELSDAVYLGVVQ